MTKSVRFRLLKIKDVLSAINCLYVWGHVHEKINLATTDANMKFQMMISRLLYWIFLEMNIKTIDMRSRVVIFMSLYLPLTAYSNVNDTIPVQELKEITVKGDRILHKDGYQVLLLDNKNRNFGTNALDAVSSLSMFITSLDDNKLVSWDRSDVFILINGVPSTGMDLRSYKGADIKNVEYYPVAPSQYMGFTEGPVVNVVMKKRHNRLYTGYFNAVNAVNTGHGTDQIDLAYSDSLNQVKIGYLLDYRDIKDISKRSEYEFLPDQISSYDNKERYHGQYHSIYGSYQHYRTNQLFNAKLYYTFEPTKETSSGEIFRKEGEIMKTVSNSTLLKTNSKGAALDLYYNYLFGNGSIFAINVVNTLGKSYSQSEISSLGNETVDSRTDSRSYSIVANTFYSSRALGGNYTVGSRYEYKQINQEYAGLKDRPYSHNEFLSLGFSWRLRDFGSIIPQIGLKILSQSAEVSAKTHVLPYLRFYADWWPQGKLKGLSTQLTLQSRYDAPSLGMLTDAYTYKDYHYLTVGNPNLKNPWENTGKLSVMYFFPGRKDQIIAMVQSGYIKDPIASMLKMVDGYAFLQPANLNWKLTHRFDLYGSWYPVSWLKVSPYIEYYIYRYNASMPVRSTYFRYGASVSATVGKFTFLLAANSPTRYFDGDLTTDGSAQYSATVQYKIRNWSFGAKFNYLGHNDRIYGEAGDFRMLENSDWRPLHSMVRLSATYSFSIGKSRSHGYKMLYESSNDNGLNQYNTPTKPE